jgi:chromatin segregation and condensation protein Rec8/ScpA/Scc1 (kleisin family)
MSALPEVSVDDLKKAWMAVVRQAKLNKSHKISREELSVREHMTHHPATFAGAWRFRAI